MDIYNQIDETLRHHAEQSNTSIINCSELDGFFFVIGCAPDLIPPSTWVPAIWGGEQYSPDWPDLETAQNFFNDTMQHYNQVMQCLNEDACEPLYLEVDTDDGEVQTITEDSCLGFRRGLSLIDGIQQKMEGHEESLFPIVLFSTEEDEAPLTDLTPQQLADMEEAIPLCVINIRNHLRTFATQPTPNTKIHSTPYTRSEIKTGRNNPCPCGSGRKYKQCCGAN